jgi:predicted nucleic acid-binding protein
LVTRRALRAGDAVQLASALYLQTRTGGKIQFVAYDMRLIEAARAEGLKTVM